MQIWILLVTFLNNPQVTDHQPGMSMDDTPEQAVRYRGIDNLLAKFDAQATP